MKTTIYIVMSYRDEEHSADCPSNGIAAHGAYESKREAEAQLDFLAYNYSDTVDFWVEETVIKAA